MLFYLKCIDGQIVRAKSISENVQEFTRQVCFLKLQEFLERYVALFLLTIGVSMVQLWLCKMLKATMMAKARFAVRFFGCQEALTSPPSGCRFTTAKQELLKRYDKSPKMIVETCLKTLNTLHGLV